ncbi:amidohydrolase family protein [Cesiribacter sp. SM1]|uniref:N-acyl-D-amino-acid deacylase family protein n=1 Tax=Cesiribacter sp. SM1 TaxID=2861196 RepID=UPI001CD2313A|nr:D-aminoacylase [Cesiribacter sp. SM1]
MRINHHSIFLYILLLCAGFTSCRPAYDVIISNGNIYDGSGLPAYSSDLAIKGNKIMAIGDLSKATAKTKIDAAGLAVSPGFINMLSWANRPLLSDGRSMSDIKQGVTLEVFGEGSSMGPLSSSMKQEMKDAQWTSLGEYLDYLVQKGVSTNVASFVGATTVRIHVLGYDDRKPSPAELKQMQELVRQAMQEGAMGLGTSLIYPPAFYADTEELVALAQAAAEYDGMYISHLRSEGNSFLEAVDEFMTIADRAKIDAEIYHLKAAGKNNWHKLDLVVQKIDSARAAGLSVSANMYTYPAASTGLDATLPPWVQEGGKEEWLKRLRSPEIRQKVLEEVNSSSNAWENFYQMAGSPDNIMLVGFDTDSLNHLVGKTLAEIATSRNADPAELIIDLILANGGDIDAIYFLMSEENVEKKIRLPYMSFGSDAGSVAAEGKRLESSTHPRTYGNFSRLLGRYVRDKKLISLEEAVMKMTSLPAGKLKIKDRGRLAPGYYADVLVFDPAQVEDKATFENPHQYATGMLHVFVNGRQVLKDGSHTGATPGMVVRGPGYKKEK